MSAHPSQAPAKNDEPRTTGDGAANLMALADAIEACLQINEMPEEPNRDERTVLLASNVAEIAALAAMPGAKQAVTTIQASPRQLMTQPLTVQPKPSAIFASRLPQPEGGPRPAHFVAAPGIELPQRAELAAVKITTPRERPAATAVALAPPEQPRKQTLFVQPKRRSKAPWMAAVALMVAAIGVGGFMERGKVQQRWAGTVAKPAAVTQPVVAQPVVAQAAPQPVVAQPAAPQAPTPNAEPVVVAPVVAVPAAPVTVAEAATSDNTDHSTARVKHRETHRQAKTTDTAQADAKVDVKAEAKPESKAEAKVDQSPAAKRKSTEDEMKKASDALLKSQLDSAI